MNKKKHGTTCEVALKLDISKAYDRVNWSFLRKRMKSMGFCETCVDWVMMCVKTVSYNVCLNGTLVGPIAPKKGLRQGDPLSPYLVLICVESFSNAIDEALSNGMIQGCQISPTAPTISHLLFADDGFLFFQANIDEATSVKNLLMNYEKCSGQSVNFQKSGVFFSSNVAEAKRREISQILGVQVDIKNTSILDYHC